METLNYQHSPRGRARLTWWLWGGVLPAIVLVVIVVRVWHVTMYIGAAPGPLTLKITVTDALTGTPVVGATISHRFSPSVTTTTTDFKGMGSMQVNVLGETVLHGSFDRTGLYESVQLRVTASGYEPAEVTTPQKQVRTILGIGPSARVEMNVVLKPTTNRN